MTVRFIVQMSFKLFLKDSWVKDKGKSDESGDCSRLRVHHGGKRDWRKHYCSSYNIYYFILFSFSLIHFIKHAKTILNQFKVQNALPIGSGRLGNASADPSCLLSFTVHTLVQSLIKTPKTDQFKQTKMFVFFNTFLFKTFQTISTL